MSNEIDSPANWNTIGRDEKGRVLPGYALNPSGRPKGRRNIIDKLAKDMYGDDFQQLFLNIVEIANYERGPKDRVPKWTNKEILDARKFLFDHVFDKAMVRVDATVEQKVLNVSINLPSGIPMEDM